MNRALVATIAQMAIFLELSDDSVIDPDAAVKQLEEMAFTLQKLSGPEQTEFVRILEELAAENSFEDQRDYLRRLPEALGIAQLND